MPAATKSVGVSAEAAAMTPAMLAADGGLAVQYTRLPAIRTRNARRDVTNCVQRERTHNHDGETGKHARKQDTQLPGERAGCAHTFCALMEL